LFPSSPPKRPANVVVTFGAISELKLNPHNPRRHSPRQIRQIAASIEAFGFNVPVLIDPGGEVIVGHGWIAAGQLLGWSEVPTICLRRDAIADAIGVVELRGRPHSSD
jgi:ParB-like chromosome segregation protein Spo0J